MQKIINKTLASLLVLTLIFSYLSVLGIYGSEVFATSIDSQNSQTRNANVEFNSRFSNGAYRLDADINSQNEKLVFEVTVKNIGYVKDAQITLEGANFEMVDNGAIEGVEQIDQTTNTIKLSRVNAGSIAKIEIPIQAIKTDRIQPEMFGKDTTVKFEATYVDEDGNEKKVEKELINQLYWTGNATIIANQTLTKYIPFETQTEKGLIMQTSLTSGFENNLLPISKTEILTKVSLIAGTEPSKVIVEAKQTVATNGNKEETKLTEANYQYDAQTDTLRIITENTQAEDGTVSWEKSGNDEYIITYIFLGDAVYEATKSTITEDFETVINLSSFDGNMRTTTIDGSIDLAEGLGQVVDFTNKTTETTLSKGYAYANYSNPETKIETEYTQILSADASYVNLVDQFELKQNSDTYLDEENNEYSSLDIYNKKVLVSESNFLNILGEDGWIEIYNAAGEKLYTINKEIGEKQKDEQGNYYIDTAEAGLDNFTFKTSKPVQEGKLEIVIQKAIKTEMQYRKSQLEVVRTIQTELEGTATLGETAVTTTTQESKIDFTEPVTKAEIAIEPKELSTAVVNENVGMTITLITDSTDDALFKNPTLNIQLPDYIDQLNIKDVNLVYGDDELAIGSYRYNQNTKTLTVQLEGTQTKYTIGAISKGAVIAITADITIDQLTSNQTSKLELHYTNGNSNYFENTDEDGLGYAETEFNVVAPSGLVTVNGIEGYSEQEVGVQSISSGEEQVGTLSIYDGIKRAKVIGKIVNNLGNTAKEVSILGRTPFKGNKTIDTNQDLGTNIDTTMLTNITLEGAQADIYYSENGEATKDLEVQGNGWTTQPQDLSKVKSYLIVLKDELAAGSLLTFYYDVEIPADLPYDSNAYTTYKVYYNNDTVIGEIPQSSLATTTGLTTQEGPKLESTFTMSSANSEYVREGEYVKFYVTVKNTGNKTAENVVGKITIPEFASYVEYVICNGAYEYPEQRELTINFGTIEVGGSATSQFFLKMKDRTAGAGDLTDKENEDEEASTPIDGDKYVRDAEITVNVTADDLAEAVTAKINFKIQKGILSLLLISDYEDKSVVSNGQELFYRLQINNLSEENVNNITTSIAIPEGLEYVEAYRRSWNEDTSEEKNTEGITYDSNTRTIRITSQQIDNQTADEICFKVRVQNEYNGEIKLYATTTVDGLDYYSNLEELSSEKISIEVSELTTSKRYVKEQEEFTYQFTIKNTSNKTIENVKITDELPTELDLIEATFLNVNNELSSYSNLVQGKLTFSIMGLQPGEEKEITIKVKAKLLSDKNDKEIQNKVLISGTGINDTETNTVTNIIEYVESLHQNDRPGGGDNPSVGTTYKISGTAWLDENGNGQKDSNESTLAGVQAILLNKSNYSVVVDSSTGAEKIVTTSDDGKYEFSNLQAGEYIVAYIFDSGIYELTTYHKDGVEEGYNSDAISMNITYQGETHNGAATDIIKITNDNAREIDIGLIRTEKFDLRIDKYITKISVTSTEGNRTYNYNNANFTKIELPSNAVDGANVVVEYKIIVKNEGGISGYAKKIIDYIPSDMGFSSNLNSDWYLGQDGNVYNTTLENTEIQPGETKELTIILTKRLTEDNLGMVTNSAEIYESYNARGVQDVDSTPGNKVQTEDDYSTASVTITLITGKVVTFVGITFVSIAIIALGAFGIKKYVIKKI